MATIVAPCYATREEVKSALDVKLTSRSDAQVDRAIASVSDDIEGFLHRKFYPYDDTRYVDWPNWQYAYPWRIWLDSSELADVTVNVPIVKSGGNVIPNADIFWGHPRDNPPFTYFELNRSKSDSFGQGDTPQRDVSITGTFGYWLKTAPAGALAGAVSSTTATSFTSTDSVAAGVGDWVVIDTERMLVTQKTMISTGQTQQSGATTASVADVALGVSDGTKFTVGETLLLDNERMLITDIAGNALTVKRAWDGTVLATHSGATIYAPRSYTVTRGALGTTAATHSNAAPISVGVPPALVKQLAIAEAENYVLQEQGGYARTKGSGQNAAGGFGYSLDSLRDRALTRYGRKHRTRVV